ncbi:hypothetical protein [Actibacterium sp.]|uniref:hypothetical protein n=1 Tax=Actibacterium sp. TaxID=1872125 RepID=UPI00356A0138
MPQLVRLYIRQILIGFALSAVFVTGLLWLNVANLGHLVSTSNMGLVAALMLFMFNGIVFAGVQFGIAVMRMADHGSDFGGGKRQPQQAFSPALVPVRVRDDRRR